MVIEMLYNYIYKYKISSNTKYHIKMITQKVILKYCKQVWYQLITLYDIVISIIRLDKQ